MVAQGRGDRILQGTARADAIADMVVQFDARVLDECEKAGTLVFVMEVEGAVPMAGLARDVLRPRRVISAFDKKLARCLF